MSRIHELKIENFRGIKKFSGKIGKDFVCLLGRGDSGKTTILDAISFVLCPSWNLSVYDSDFFNGDTNCPIMIEVTLLDIPEKFINEEKYGLYIRGIDRGGEIHDELQHDHIKALTIRLEINKNLEPEWCVVNNRQEPVRISGGDRSRLNVFMVSDYIDKHFSWSKGSPLYSILRESQSPGDAKNDIIIEALREAKEKIDKNSFDHFNNVTDQIKKISLDLGVDLSKAKTTVDFRDVSIRDGRVCLHDEDVPLRLKGKGTKRLISMAIQSILVEHGGIVLIDEVEQGLEPDRVKHLVRSLKKENAGQIFLTTHSSEVISELDADDLVIVSNSNGNVTAASPDKNFQDVIRACPEAGYAKRVIVCEGKTEIGICRALDTHRKSQNKESMSAKGCIYVCGGGHSFADRAKKLKELGLETCVFCDSDDKSLNPTKEDLKKSGVKIFDCDDGDAIEHQIFKDLAWEGIKTLINYVTQHRKMSESQIRESIKSKYSGEFPTDYLNADSSQMRKALADASLVNDKEWFKRIDHGEFLGDVIFKHISDMDGKSIKNQLDGISCWIDT
jgi:predicted ATP-dependent endonuclease of OLD family